MTRAESECTTGPTERSGCGHSPMGQGLVGVAGLARGDGGRAGPWRLSTLAPDRVNDGAALVLSLEAEEDSRRWTDPGGTRASNRMERGRRGNSGSRVNRGGARLGQLRREAELDFDEGVDNMRCG